MSDDNEYAPHGKECDICGAPAFAYSPTDGLDNCRACWFGKTPEMRPAAESIDRREMVREYGYAILSKRWGLLWDTFGRTLEECWCKHDRQAGDCRDAWKADPEDPRDAVKACLTMEVLS